jgi:hypothetical protein
VIFSLKIEPKTFCLLKIVNNFDGLFKPVGVNVLNPFFLGKVSEEYKSMASHYKAKGCPIISIDT